LFGDNKAMLFIANEQRRRQISQTAKAQEGGLQHRVFADQRQELLWVFLAGERPEASAGATREDDGEDFGHENIRL
jgi:hypothetical protein